MSDPAYFEHVRTLNPLGRLPETEDFEVSHIIREQIYPDYDPFDNAAQGACTDKKGNLFVQHSWKPNVKIHQDVNTAPSASDYKTASEWADADEFVFEMPALVMYDKYNRDAIASADLGSVFFGHQQFVIGRHNGKEYCYTSFDTFENYYRFHTRMPNGTDVGGKHWSAANNAIDVAYDTWTKAASKWDTFGSGIELHQEFVTDADNAYIMRFEIVRNGNRLSMINPGKVQWIGNSTVATEIVYDRFNSTGVDMSDANNTVGHNVDRTELCMEIDWDEPFDNVNYQCMKFGSLKVERTLGGLIVDARAHTTNVVNSKLRTGIVDDVDGFLANTFIQGMAIVENKYLCVTGQAKNSVANRLNVWAFYDRDNGETLSLRNCLAGSERPYDLYEAEGIFWSKGVLNFMIKNKTSNGGAEPYFTRNKRYYQNAQYRCVS